VHLQFRGNEGQIDQEEADMGHGEPLVEALFAKAPPFRPEPDTGSVLAALRVLQEAARPVIVAGGGVRASGAGAELVALAERLAVPVATSLNGKDAIPGTHPLSVGVVGTYSRESANRVVARADAVCFIGTETGGMTTHFWAVPRIGVPAVQIDIDPQALGRNYPLQAAVLGDAKVTLARMLAHANADASGLRKAWAEEAQGMCRDWRDKYAADLTSDAIPVRPERICAELTRHTPDDAIRRAGGRDLGRRPALGADAVVQAAQKLALAALPVAGRAVAGAVRIPAPRPACLLGRRAPEPEAPGQSHHHSGRRR
jgi:acetolactate synthase-1/2/3 large subunit